jgi:hypothetical protein
MTFQVIGHAHFLVINIPRDDAFFYVLDFALFCGGMAPYETRITSEASVLLLPQRLRHTSDLRQFRIESPHLERILSS